MPTVIPFTVPWWRALVRAAIAAHPYVERGRLTRAVHKIGGERRREKGHGFLKPAGRTIRRIEQGRLTRERWTRSPYPEYHTVVEDTLPSEHEAPYGVVSGADARVARAVEREVQRTLYWGELRGMALPLTGRKRPLHIWDWPTRGTKRTNSSSK